jgi:endonuclease/exonuclease/phosphatase family metal-dependent hydrolase
MLSALAAAAGCSDDVQPNPDAALPDAAAPDQSGHDLATDARDATSDAALLDGPPADAVDAAQDDTQPPDSTPPPDQAVVDAGPSKGPLRVATFNCWCLKDKPALRAKGIALEVQQLKPDAVGLQEVCQGTSSGGSDNFAKTVAAEIKALTGQDWEYKFAKTHVAWSTWDEGVGLLAPKGSFKASGEQTLPKGGGSFPRKVIWARIGTTRGDFYLYSTHLTISSNPADREAQAKAIVTLAASHATSLPQVVVGDFNDWYASAAVNAMKKGPPVFTESWGTKHPGSTTPGLTCCHPSFGSRIDYVFVKSTSLKSLDTMQLAFDKAYSGQVLSDHKGLFLSFSPK